MVLIVIIAKAPLERGALFNASQPEPRIASATRGEQGANSLSRVFFAIPQLGLAGTSLPRRVFLG